MTGDTPNALTPLQQAVADRITEADWQALTTELVAAGQPAAENPLGACRI